jgi:5-methylcytosine-specific restriction endonuclease McrA
MKHKICTKCKKEKTLDEFGKEKRVISGLQTQCKACAYIQRRQWCEKNIERYRHLQKQWQEMNPEKVAAKKKKYLSKEENKVKNAIYQKRWKSENKEKHAGHENKRRVLLAGSGGNHTNEEWVQLKKSCGNKCVSCGRSEVDVLLTRDHIIPVFYGGSNNIDNIQPLCQSCNSSKSTKTINFIKLQHHNVV